MKETERKAFIDGGKAHLKLGGYAGTVHVKVEGGRVSISATKPTRMQRVVGDNSKDMREAAVGVADRILEELRVRRAPKIPPRRPKTIRNGRELLTARDIFEGYVEDLLGDLPDEFWTYGRADLEELYKGASKVARAGLPSVDYLFSVLTAARFFDRTGLVSLNGDFDALEPGEISRGLKRHVMLGMSPHSVCTYLDRLRTAVTVFKEQFPTRWDDRKDPTAKVKRPSTKGIEPDEVGEEEASRIAAELRRAGDWRTYSAVTVALGSGRRIGAIAGARVGLHLDAPPLRASDFRRDERGTLWVTWRADVQKGGAYGRGDVEQICPRSIEVVFRFLTRFHPNPLGPEYPLIWDADDSRRAASYDDLSKALGEAWERAFGTKKPKGLGFHGYCRTTITTVMDEFNSVAAAELTGRTVETVERRYKRRRQTRQVEVVKRLDEVRRGSRGRMGRKSMRPSPDTKES